MRAIPVVDASAKREIENYSPIVSKKTPGQRRPRRCACNAFSSCLRSDRRRGEISRGSSGYPIHPAKNAEWMGTRERMERTQQAPL
jgi:hypothetical protein